MRKLGAAPGPAARQIGMRERFGFVEEHQIYRPRRGLGFQIGKVLTARRHRACLLALSGCGVASSRQTPPAQLSQNHRGEIAGPPCRAISAHKRGRVQPPSWRVPSFKIAAIAPACGSISPCRPGLGAAAAPPPRHARSYPASSAPC